SSSSSPFSGHTEATHRENRERRRRRGQFSVHKRGLRVFPWRVMGAWWPPRSSKPLSARCAGRGMFDSYPLRHLRIVVIVVFEIPAAGNRGRGRGEEQIGDFLLCAHCHFSANQDAKSGDSSEYSEGR